jgi:hypothetical protein
VPGNLIETQKRLAQNSETMQVVLQMMQEMKNSRELIAKHQADLMMHLSAQQKNHALSL